MTKKAKKKNGFSNMQDILTALNNETINNRQMDDEFAESFISYSMMTILDRAIPKIDGCKPSQRRTLYDMYTLGLKPEGSYKKCARVAGDTIGRFHPHGDGCCIGDTKMYLANGEIKTLKQLEEEGKSVEVFCANDKNGKLERGIAHHFRITKYVNELYHIKLFNGEEIVCTENHPFLMNNLQWKRADEIKRFDSFYNYVIRDINGKPSYENMTTHEYIELNRIGLDEVEDENLVKTNEEYDKLQKTLIKAFKTLRELEEKQLPLTLDNYNMLRDEASKKFHYPKIKKMIRRGQISSFENLVEMYNKGEIELNSDLEEVYNEKEKKMKKNLKYTYIAFSKMVKYALDKGIEISRENYDDVFNMLLNEYKRKHAEDRKYGFGISLEKLEVNYNFEDILNRFYYDNLIIKEVIIEKVDNVPVYDFTEDVNHNALLYLGELNNRLSVIATHNSVYGALVNMVNDFDIRYPLIDGQGNFGSPDGDSAAAARYTESKLTKLGMEMLADINNDAVEMVPTFSEEENEPIILPSKFPAILCNGATGIATGYTTEIPSHNLIEVCNGIIAYLKNKDISLEEMVKDYIKGPDLPSKGYLLNTPEILELYRTGKASIKFKAKLHIEENKDTGNNQIIITELPPDVQKPKLVKKIYDFYDIENSKSKDRKVLDVIDGSEGKDIAIIIELNKTTNPQEIIDDLYDKLSLTKSKTYIMRIVDDNQPKLLGLLSLIELYVKHRRSVIFRRSKHRLTEIENKIEILKGLVLINPHIKEVTNIIISSNDVKEAKENLIQKFNLTEKQANHILETKLRVLTRQEAGKLTNDLNELSKEKNELMTLISSDNNLDLEIIKEMEYLKKNYGDDRKTTIMKEEEFKKANNKQFKVIINNDLKQEMYICLSTQSKINCLTPEEFTKFEKKKSYKINRDLIKKVVKCQKKDNFIAILKNGSFIKMDFNSLVSNAVLDKEDEIVNLFIDDGSEKVVLMVTDNGFGKKTKISNFKGKNIKKLTAINMEDKINVIFADVVEDSNDYSINEVTESGSVHRCSVTSFNASGLNAKPMKIAGLEDEKLVCVNVSKISDSGKILCYAKNNKDESMFKAIDLNEFAVKGRTSKPVKTYVNKNVNYEKFVILNKDSVIMDSKYNLLDGVYNKLECTERSKKPEVKKTIEYIVL